MNFKKIAFFLCLLPVAVYGAERASSGTRVGVVRSNPGGVRLPSLANISTKTIPASTVIEQRGVVAVTAKSEEPSNNEVTKSDVEPEIVVEENTDCRAVYRACMDDFCLLDETEGARCACSDNIEKSKSLIQEIQKIQSEADDLYTVGVERERLGAKAKIVFGESDNAKKRSLRSGIDFSSWLNGGFSDGELGEDADIGQNLYSMAADACAAELEKCGDKANAEELLYNRMIVNDCKSFSSYLADQKRDAEANKRTAEAAVRSARLEMFETTNKYNRGECLLVYRSCIADKGGCGVNFENCLDEGLLSRRANACSDVLDQCMAVRDDVLRDWEEESVAVLKDAAKYADRNQRATCLAKIQNCLEESCSTGTETACLVDVNVAAGICPIIGECNEKIPGLRAVINDKLGYLQTKFCENDVDACLKDKCGTDFTRPECVGKSSSQIAALCPQSMFPSCKNAQQYDVIVSSVLLHMDYQLLTGCINQYAEKLTAVCGMDMSCIPVSELLPAVNGWVDLNSADGKKLFEDSQIAAKTAVDKFFTDFERDVTLSACQDVYGEGTSKVKNRKSMIDGVNAAAKIIAYQSAKNRADRELVSVMNELKVQQESDNARKYCLEIYKKEQKPDEEGTYTYIRSVSYEANTQSCHVCRMQRVCETGGEKKGTSALKAAGGGFAAGMAAGQALLPGWGMAIGALGGAAALGLGGYMLSDGEQEYCQELESCEDINVSGASLD